MSDQNVGKRIKNEREKLGWDQAALAKAMGVRQQTVSRWESGQSRPRRDDVQRLAELFKSDPNEWLAEAGYQIDKPVRPLVAFLPLDKLTAETFELFAVDFVQALHPRADVARYGSQGHTQEGIDLYSKEGDTILDYQCKRHKQFGAGEVAKVVADTTFVAAHHHLLLARQASPAARKEMNNYPDWSLWDVENISAKVRSLPIDDALRIVDTYFPSWRKDFLGVEEPSPWLSPDQFYRPLTSRSKIFSHGWTLVGRRDEVQALLDFDTPQGVSQALILSGRGGVGKSRVLRDFAESLPQGQRVTFLAAGADVTPKDIELLPEDGVLVIDDAHEYIDLRSLFSSLVLLRPNLKIILSTRPYGVTRIKDEFVRAGIALGGNIISLGDLRVDDARALSAEIIDAAGGDTQYASRIAEITKDCPLATVVGSRLVADGRIRPELLNNSEEFRSHLLRSFQDIIAGEIGGPKDAESIRELLDFVSLIQPIDTSDPRFEAAAKTFLGRRYDKILRDLRALEDAGVLLRRRNRLRIVPDLLADYIREAASYDEKSHRPTGYADEVFKVVSDDLATNLLVNLSQLDWRISANGAQSEILDQVWSELETQFLHAKILPRTMMLSAVEKVAYYQPARALAFAILAMSHPTNEVEDIAPKLLLGHPTYADVLHKLPPILKYVAYDSEHLMQALDMLKELAKQDTRQPNQAPDHPMRALTELASIVPGKPLEYVEMLVGHVLSWLPDEDSDVFSPFDVVQATLATEGQEPEFSGITLTLKPYTIRASAVSDLRRQIIDKAFETILTRPVTEAIRAVRIIEESLRGPAGGYATPEDAASWEPDFLATLQRLQEVVANTTLDPYVSVEIRSAVQWHATYSETATGPAAKAVVEAISTTTDYELSRALADGWGWTFERSAADHRRDDAAFLAWRQEIARKLVAEHAHDYSKLIQVLEERLAALARLKVSRHADPGPFIATLVEQSPAFGEALGEHVIANPESPLATAFGVIIASLATDRYERAVALTAEGVNLGNSDMSRHISRALGWGLRNVPIGPLEMQVIEQLGQSDDLWTRHQIVHVVNRFPKEAKSQAIKFLLDIDLGTSKELADEILGEFSDHGPFAITDLDADQVKGILANLVALDSIDDYNIGNFLSTLSLSQPSLVLHLLFDRVECHEAHKSPTGYTPLPHAAGRPAFRFHDTAEYERLLRVVRDWTNVNPKSWYRRHFGSEIFKMVSAGYDEATLRVLDEWIASPSQQQLETAATLLGTVDSSFVWRHPEFIANVLNRAQQFGDACYQQASGVLYGTAIQGVRSGTPGQPFPEDIELRDRSQTRMSTLSPGSPAYRFYKALYEHAVARIKQDTIDVEDLFED